MARPNVEVERRAQILDATCAVVSEKGFHRLRVADVARRATTSTGTVHYYFETKTDLVRAAFEWNFSQSLARRMPVLRDEVDPRNLLRAFVDSYLPDDPVTIRAWHVWAELWVAALHDGELRDLNDKVYGEWRRTMTDIVRAGQAAGIFRGDDPAAAANAIIAMIDGLAIQVLLRSSSMTVDGMRTVCERALRDLETQGTAGPVTAGISDGRHSRRS